MQASFRLGTDGIYRCDAFQQFLWQSHGFGTRAGSPDAAVTLKQIHSDTVANVIRRANREQEGDALITDQTGLAIGVRTADCLPILMLDERTHAVAAVHAGWRGSAAAIVRGTIARMTADFGTTPSDLYAAIGPCIRSCCYHVGIEVAQQLAPYFPEWGPVTAGRTVDLAETNRRQMLESGVLPERIFDSELCTACDLERFHSHRREPANPGRMLASIQRLL